MQPIEYNRIETQWWVRVFFIGAIVCDLVIPCKRTEALRSLDGINIILCQFMSILPVKAQKMIGRLWEFINSGGHKG